MNRWSPLSLENVRTYPLRERKSKVSVSGFGTPWTRGKGLRDWLERLPRFLAAEDLREVVDRVVSAVLNRKTVLLGMGAHPIKVGLGPVLIDLMEQGILSGIALNGAGVIHDVEVALVGSTSEDVAEGLGQGLFGMAEETGRFINEAAIQGAREDLGLGEAVGRKLLEDDPPFKESSLLAKASQKGVPVTVHVAIGTDIVHCHPAVDGAALGKTSHRDFLTFASLVSSLDEGVYINLGSAVLLPEVFLKALSLARNLGQPVRNLTTLNMDFATHYRPLTNVVKRPTLEGGKGYNLIGHHEIMLPLLAALVVESLQETSSEAL